MVFTRLSQSPPYCEVLPNGTFVGYSVDLIRKLSEELGFKQEMHLVADGSHGSQTNSSKYRYGWDGMIGEILEGVS
jgi:ABC-type amino acid transport substrate-binding protein